MSSSFISMCQSKKAQNDSLQSKNTVPIAFMGIPGNIFFRSSLLAAVGDTPEHFLSSFTISLCKIITINNLYNSVSVEGNSLFC